jgi:hypothetical protein
MQGRGQGVLDLGGQSKRHHHYGFERLAQQIPSSDTDTQLEGRAQGNDAHMARENSRK